MKRRTAPGKAAAKNIAAALPLVQIRRLVAREHKLLELRTEGYLG